MLWCCYSLLLDIYSSDVEFEIGALSREGMRQYFSNCQWGVNGEYVNMIIRTRILHVFLHLESCFLSEKLQSSLLNKTVNERVVSSYMLKRTPALEYARKRNAHMNT